MIKFLPLLFLITTLLHAGTANEARRLQLDYELADKEWVAAIRAAKDPDVQANLWATRPDPKETGEKMWQEIKSNLSESWTIDPAVWLLDHAPKVVYPTPLPGQNMANPPALQIRKAFEKHHLLSPKIGPYCIGITLTNDPTAFQLLETIEAKNPDVQVQGAAALGQAILLRKLGDSGDLQRTRITKIRKAIINSADMVVGKTTVAKLAEDELFTIQNLSIGREAPDITGKDIAGRDFKLSDYRGQVVVLAYWNTWMPDADAALALMRTLNTRLKGEKAAIIGINQDNAETLRAMTADESIPWRNFHDSNQRIAKEYHLNFAPKLFVIDKEGVIQYIGAPGAFIELAVKALL